VELSPRQREVLGLLAHGLSNKEIASTLHLAPSTIANLVSGLLSQTGAHNRAELASLAALSGIADEPGPMAC
jgi:DNA-binding NarL/FixJ family response regulator